MRPFAASGLGSEPPTAPVPISATFAFTDGATGVLTVNFDQPLQPGATASANWIFHAGLDGTFPAGPAGTVTESTVKIVKTRTLLTPDSPTRCDYLAAPADVLSLGGLPAVAFADFPVTVI